MHTQTMMRMLFSICALVSLVIAIDNHVVTFRILQPFKSFTGFLTFVVGSIIAYTVTCHKIRH